jgi:hypothetical protein
MVVVMLCWEQNEDDDEMMIHAEALLEIVVVGIIFLNFQSSLMIMPLNVNLEGPVALIIALILIGLGLVIGYPPLAWLGWIFIVIAILIIVLAIFGVI